MKSLSRSISRSISRSVTDTRVRRTSGPSLLTGDRYISPTGDDSANGLTRETAWATLTKINNDMISLASAGSRTYVVTAGEYLNQGILYTSGGTKTVVIDFEPGVTVDSSASLSRIDGIAIGNSPSFDLTINLRAAEFIGNTVSSANGIGFDGDIRLTINGANNDGDLAQFSGYDDGFSGHLASVSADNVVVNDCRFWGCGKAPVFHVGSSKATHNRCVFEANSASSGLGGNDSSGSKYYDCIFTPGTNRSFRVRSGVYDRCKFGTITEIVQIVPGIGMEHCSDAVMRDCFIRTGNQSTSITDSRIFAGGMIWERCYGRCVIRSRSASVNTGGTIRNGCFIQSQFWRNANIGHTKMTIVDNVVIDGHFGQFYTSAEITAWNAGSVIQFCCLRNTVVETAIAETATNNITDNPLVGSVNTTNQIDWVVSDDSSCVGAGSIGGNIGFTLADIAQ